MFKQEKADRIIQFIEELTFTKGEWAGEPFKLMSWQKDIITELFGRVNDKGYRQYRTCYVEIPKKNGKTEVGAAIGLYMLCADREGSPEVYSAAADRENASLIYQAASFMVRNNPDLSKYLTVLDSRKRIINKRNNGFYQVLSAESYTKHGISPSCILFDELHAQPNDELWNVLTSGTDYARRQQLIFVMTTAGIYDTTSVWWRIRNKAIQIQKGVIKDDSFLPVLYLADPETDNPDDEELWKRVNPSLGQIFDLDKIRADYQKAKQDPVEFQNFLRFRLNIPIKQISRWLPMQAWDKCNGSVDPQALQRQYCYGGLDLSSKLDLTAFVLVFPPQNGDKYQILCRFYVPEENVMKRSHIDTVHYDIWADQGYIVMTPGNVIDTEFILRDIVKASEDYTLQEVGYDPWGATDIANKLFNDYGIKMVEIRQGTRTLSEPAKDLLVKIMQQKINHGNNPVLRWCMDNLVMVKDANENIRPDKEKATERIDGAVALINAWKCVMFTELGPSVYDERGIEII
jgi:phage terminase large subunit-like protein